MRSAPTSPSPRPAFPDNKRTVFKGYLFAGDVLLNESGMQNHPLTPMTDANLVRVLQAQTRRKVGLIDHAAVARGAAAIRERIAQLRARGRGHRDRRCGVERRPAAPRPGAGGHAAGHGRLGRGDRAAGQLRHRAFVRRRRAAGGAAACRRWCRAAARSPPTGRCRTSSRRAGRRWRSIRLRIAAGVDVVGRGAGLGRAAAAKPARCWSIRPPSPAP